MKHKVVSLIVSLALIAGFAVPALAVENAQEPVPQRQRIVIENVEDFLNFAQSCALDTWSLDKDVILTADISLEGMDFSGIPTFGGSFDGGGHTISGFHIAESMAPAGLFRYVQHTGVVKNLTVSGKITPDGDAATVGGIAGENRGLLEDCGFSGSLKGERDTGGIAGVNYGTIRRCSTSGSLTGESRTGGVAGYNCGILDSCENSMEINVDSVDPKIDPTAIDLNWNMDLSQISRVDTADAAVDTGGIAGYSAGTILNCANTGSVGYPHIGYNLGGIAGRNSGFVSDCVNSGDIRGRKDVGGILGQMEPEIAAVLSPDYLETLSKQFQNLGNLVSAAGSHASGAGEDVRACVQTLAVYQSSAQAAIEILISGVIGDIEDGSIQDAPDQGAVQSLRNAIQGMANTTNVLQGIVAEGVEDVSDDANAISGQISSISKTFALATEDTKQEPVTDLSTVDLSEISEGKVLRCTNKGTVEGDLNVGGIAGMMGMEYAVDPEDDAPSGSLTQRRRYELKAIVQDCVNLGAVTGKHSYAGGICGRMELGLITSSQSYGDITSENGDYVGGIAGMTGGTIRNCFAKCTLAGGSYIGGIVGCGIQEDYSGESSTVSDCYSMVCVERYAQYVGGISGMDTGVYTGNYFVSDTLQGINGVSYFALAEPISYQSLRKIENLPDTLRQLTLTFTADGKILKTLTFDYGDSFDASVYPDLPQKEGFYAQWSTQDLTNLRFDTVVEAEYIPLITALNWETTRPDGRPVLFVQGRFQDGDELSVVPGATEFLPGKGETLLEQWSLSIPADGQERHSIRYLPSQENVEIYVLKNESWSQVTTENMGSYLAFDAAGAEVEITVVSKHTGALGWLLPAAVAAVCLSALALWRKNRKGRNPTPPVPEDTSPSACPSTPNKKKARDRLLGILFLLAVILLTAVLLCFPRTKAGKSLYAYDILKTYMEQPEQAMHLTVKAQIADRDAGFTADIRTAKVADTTVHVISESGRRLYFANGVVFLENGDAFRLNSTAPDYSELMGQLLDVTKHVQVEAVDGVYTVTAEGAQATAIGALLIPSAESLLPEANSLTVDLITAGDTLTQIQFTGAGNLMDSVKTPFSVSATVDILPVSDDAPIPDAVAQAISAGDPHPNVIYSDDLIRLMEAWSQARAQNPLTAQVALEADCGPLTVRDTFLYAQWKLENSIIHGVEKNGTTIYFTEKGICNGEGKLLPSGSLEEVDASALIEVIYGNFRSADFQCRQEEAASVYTVSLNPSGMKQLGETLLPQTKDMGISYTKGSIQLRIEEGNIQSVRIVCSGSGKVIAAQIEVQIAADIRFQTPDPTPDLPEAVKEAVRK